MTKKYEGDYEYEVATQIIHQEYEPRVSAYIPAAETFYGTISRVIAFHQLPLNLIPHMYMNAMSHAAAAAEAGHDPADLNFEMTEKDLKAAHDAFVRLSTQIEAHGGLNRYFRITGQEVLRDMLKTDFVANRQKRSAASVGIEAMLAAIITAAYGALETMAEDLWIAAVNWHPELSDNWIDKHDKAELRMADLKGHRYAMLGQMGTYLARKKVKFDSFYQIKDAYLDAFREEMAPVFANYDNVWHAEKVRHLIAHRAGIMDLKFKEELGDRDEYKGINVGEHIPFTGPIVQNHFNACIQMGGAILRTVDFWSYTAAPKSEAEHDKNK